MHVPKLDQPKSTPIPAKNIKNAAISGCHEPCTYESIKLPTSIPQREMLLIWIIHASQGFQTTMLFPMLVFMVWIGWRKRAVYWKICWYIGITISFCTILHILDVGCSFRQDWEEALAGIWKPCICSVLFTFGTMQELHCCLFGQISWRTFNGTVTITKSMLGELCDESNQAKGFGVLSLAWGIGSISGSVITGWLAQPCHQYHINHCPPFLQQYPFFLPCTVATTFSIAAIFASWSLKETNTRKLMYQQVPCQNMGREDVLPSQVKIVNNLQFRKEKLEDCFDIKEVADESTVKGMESQSTMNLFAKANSVELEGPEESDKFLSIALDDTKGEQPCLKRRDQWILLDRNVLLTTFCYSMTGLIFIITDELFPIFGAASTNVGGLGFSSFTLGLILGEGGVVLFLYTLLLDPIVARNICTLNYFRYGLVLSVPLWILFPLSTILSGVPQLQFLLLLAAMATRSVIVCNTFTGIMIIVSNSATPSSMGVVTGLSHSCCSFFRAIGPALGGMIWSYATKCKFPFHQFLAWLFVAALSLFTFGLSFLLPPSLNLPKSTHLENM